MKQQAATTSEVLTPAQVARYLQVHKLTVYRYVRERQLPAVRLGRSLRILKADVDEFLRLHRVGGRIREPIRKTLGRRQTDRRVHQAPRVEVRRQYQEPPVSPLVEAWSRHDVLTLDAWDWVARGLHWDWVARGVL